MTIDDDSPTRDIDLARSDDRPTLRSDTLQADPVDGQNIDIIASGPAPWRAYLRALGPGLVTGASDDDPSGIATYAHTGAQFGFGMLWVALITFPLMAGVQEICDRVGILANGVLAREGALPDLLAIENQTDVVLENASPNLLREPTA